MSDNPVLTMSGVMPGGPEMTNWRTAMNNHPSAGVYRRPASTRGPSISMAGVMPGAPCVTHWQTAYPNGEAIYVVALRQEEARAALQAKVIELPKRTTRRQAPKAA